MSALSQPPSIAVLASGGGTNLQALIDRFHGDPSAPLEIGLVIGGRPGIGALERAERAGIPTLTLRDHSDGAALLTSLRAHRIEWLALAGYLRLVPEVVVGAYRDRIVNIHPALLPSFGGQGMYGRRVHEAVLAAGVRVSGATVHFVDLEYDTGRIVAQWPVLVRPGDTVEALAARVLEAEHRLYPAVLARLVRGEDPERIDLGAGGHHLSSAQAAGPVG